MGDERKPLSMIACMASNRVIGRDGAIPWKHAEDMRRFKALTMGHAIIMGRKTYDSIGRALPGRTNIVITRNRHRNPGMRHRDHSMLYDLGNAIAYARRDDPEPFIIGGAQIYAEAMPLATTLHLTVLDEAHEGDVLFPEWDASEWILSAIEKASGAVFQTWQRKGAVKPGRGRT